MGIATSTGVIRDFAGPYTVSEDNLAFGAATKYWQLDYKKCRGSVKGWDTAVAEASEVYKTRMVKSKFKQNFISQLLVFPTRKTVNLFVCFSTIYFAIIVIRMYQWH